MSSARVVALVTDLMDRSRLTAAVPGIEFVRHGSECAGATIVVIDLARHGDEVAPARAAAPAPGWSPSGPTSRTPTSRRARAEGADLVLPRSRFFRDPAGAVGGPGAEPG